MSEVQIQIRNGKALIRVVVEEYGEESVEAMDIGDVRSILQEMESREKELK